MQMAADIAAEMDFRAVVSGVYLAFCISIRARGSTPCNLLVGFLEVPVQLIQSLHTVVAVSLNGPDLSMELLSVRFVGAHGFHGLLQGPGGLAQLIILCLQSLLMLYIRLIPENKAEVSSTTHTFSTRR